MVNVLLLGALDGGIVHAQSGRSDEGGGEGGTQSLAAMHQYSTHCPIPAAAAVKRCTMLLVCS
jgi:hypothetical protein